MSYEKFEYGIFIENGMLYDLNTTKVTRTALLGKVFKVNTVVRASESHLVPVRLLKDFDTWESVTYEVDKGAIAPVLEEQWQFIASISSPIERVKLARNKERCLKLLNIKKDIQVGFDDTNEILLATIKFVGLIKGIGMGVGLQLMEKKKGNQCNGYCAGVQYFTCLPGKGVFTTIEKISIINSISRPIEVVPENILEKNLSSLALAVFESDPKPRYEEIVTKYGEYPNNLTTKSSKKSNMKTSLSLQNINIDSDSQNSNNDFDNNSVIGPDRTYLVSDKEKLKTFHNKSEIDLVGTWTPCYGDKTGSVPYNNLRQSVDSNSSVTNGGLTNGVVRHKTMSALASNMFDGSLASKKSKLVVNSYPEKKSSASNKKINERSEQLVKACSSKSNNDKPRYVEPPKSLTKDLTIGTLVEVPNSVTRSPLYGVVRWMGMESGTNYVWVGIELDFEQESDLPLTLTDGTHKGERFFKCSDKKALFVPIGQCRKDSRFQDEVLTPVHTSKERILGEFECPVIEGAVAPLCMPTEEDVKSACGKKKGIQGHHNSCYLDVTLFSMFTFTSVFDSLLFRPKGPGDIEDYEEVQRVLREEIVNPLRQNLFVSADHVMNLRKLLDRLSSVSGLTSEEKDPEEFLNSLLAQILKGEPYLKLSSGQEAFYYQLFVEKDSRLTLPTVQQLFEQSFLTSNITLKEVPSCLIIQMPRFGKNYKMYPRILPSQLLDVTDVIEGSPRQCTMCGKLAHYECRECFDQSNNVGLESTAFCSRECLRPTHQHEKRQNHKPKLLNVPHDLEALEPHPSSRRLFMELFAVICIETSHYVAFVKCGVGHEAPWCFFDSMADRKGERNGFNIPEMVACHDISRWLSDETQCRQLNEEFPNDRYLPEHARRLFCDAYICMYQSSDVMMYR